jgi:hypothetical protein
MASERLIRMPVVVAFAATARTVSAHVPGWNGDAVAH